MLAAAFGTPQIAQAHCDSLDGPVVNATRAALAENDADRILIWVLADDEAIKRAFEQTLALRKLNPEARDLADMYFFETLVRIHRAREGVAYTGLKTSGTDFGPSIPATDKAIKSENIEPVMQLLSKTTKRSTHERFQEILSKKEFDQVNIEAGREFVEVYVKYTHYVKGIYGAAARTAIGHFPATDEGAPQHKDEFLIGGEILLVTSFKEVQSYGGNELIRAYQKTIHENRAI